MLTFWRHTALFFETLPRFQRRVVHNAFSKSHQHKHSLRSSRSSFIVREPMIAQLTDVTSNTTVSRNSFGETVPLRRSSPMLQNRVGIKIIELGRRKASRVCVGSSIVSIFTSPRIQGTWTCSKELCPSTVPTSRNLSTSGFQCKSSKDFENVCKTTSPGNVKESEDSCEGSVKRDSCNSGDNVCDTPKKDECSTSREKMSRAEDTCSRSSTPSICDIPRLQCHPPSLRELYPVPGRKVLMFWRLFCMLIVLPILAVSSVLLLEKSKKERQQPRPPFLDVPYLYRITKPYPWGDGKHSFFHNPIKNPIPPHGYEAEDPYAVTKTDKK